MKAFLFVLKEGLGGGGKKVQWRREFFFWGYGIYWRKKRGCWIKVYANDRDTNGRAAELDSRPLTELEGWRVRVQLLKWPRAKNRVLEIV